MKLDMNKPYGTIHGHPTACFEQNGVMFDGTGKAIDVAEEPAAPEVDTDKIIQTTEVESAKAFLKNILGQGPMAKSIVYSEAEKNNQPWESVKTAAADIGVVSVPIGVKNKQEGWKLPGDAK